MCYLLDVQCAKYLLLFGWLFWTNEFSSLNFDPSQHQPLATHTHTHTQPLNLRNVCLLKGTERTTGAVEQSEERCFYVLAWSESGFWHLYLSHTGLGCNGFNWCVCVLHSIACQYVYLVEMFLSNTRALDIERGWHIVRIKTNKFKYIYEYMCIWNDKCSRII